MLKNKLKSIMLSPQSIELLQKIELMRQSRIIYPEQKDIYRALEVTNLDDLKVIILGQDPYHRPEMADGLAFSSKSILPKSLKNIMIEINKDFPNVEFGSNQLDHWACQGVLLMNTILSVEKGKPLSHKTLGWQLIVTELLNTILDNTKDIIICLWGNNAKKFGNKLHLNNHVVLENSHPSPLGYYRNFKNKQIFKKINKLVENFNKKQIKWNTTKE